MDYLATLRHAHVTLGRRHWGTVLLTYLILPAPLPIGRTYWTVGIGGVLGG